MYLVPVVGGVTSWLLFGEGFGPLKITGAALVRAGLGVARRRSASEPSPARRLVPRYATGLPRGSGGSKQSAASGASGALGLVGHQLEEQLDETGIEMPPRLLADVDDGLLRAERGPVGTVRA